MIRDFITEKLLVAQTVVNPRKEDLGLPDIAADDDFAKKLFTIVFGVSAAIAVLVIVILALNMTKSDGNPEEVSKAKRGIIFTLVGLMIVLSAEAIVYFVMERL